MNRHVLHLNGSTRPVVNQFHSRDTTRTVDIEKDLRFRVTSNQVQKDREMAVQLKSCDKQLSNRKIHSSKMSKVGG
jgi:hypothetical protein